MKKLLILVIVLCIMIFVVYTAKKQPHQRLLQQQFDIPFVEKPKIEIPFEQAVNGISEANLLAHMNFLCSKDNEGRMSGKIGNKNCSNYIEQQFSSYGLKTSRQKFSIPRVNPGPKNEIGDDFTENIIAWIEGNDEVMVIGAHFDHLGYGPKWSMASQQGLKIHPGADDNASGTSALLEIARIYSKYKTKRTVVFIAFSGEEMGLLGSKYYCNNPLFPISKHIFMLNFDMIGNLNNKVNNNPLSPDLRNIIQRLSDKYPFGKSITSSSSGGSDHASFASKKIPVCILHTGQHPRYHTPQDTVESINMSGMVLVAKYATELAKNIELSDRITTFSAIFDDSSDHGIVIFKTKD